MAAKKEKRTEGKRVCKGEERGLVERISARTSLMAAGKEKRRGEKRSNMEKKRGLLKKQFSLRKRDPAENLPTKKWFRRGKSSSAKTKRNSGGKKGL